MSYDEAKEATVKLILDNPAEFLTEYLKERRPFYNKALAVFDVEEKPTILRLTAGDHVHVVITSWDHFCHSLKRVDLGFHTRVMGGWGNLAWEEGFLVEGAPIQTEEPYWVHDKAMAGDSLECFRFLAQSLNREDRTSLDCAWYFPFGTRKCKDNPGLMMYASNQEDYSEYPKSRLSTFQTLFKQEETV